jgi:hypothetical protein
MKRVYLLAAKAPGVSDRLVMAYSRAGALAIVAESTWDATPADPAVVRALGHLGVVVEDHPTDKPELDLAGTEGGE